MTELDLEKINKFAPFCLSCLGRSVGLVGFGLDKEREGWKWPTSSRYHQVLIPTKN